MNESGTRGRARWGLAVGIIAGGTAALLGQVIPVGFAILVGGALFGVAGLARYRLWTNRGPRR
jgi:hypothetical protein